MRRWWIVALAALMIVTPVWARITPKIVYTPGTVQTDTITWKASGTLPGTTGVRVDTLVAALDDTSASVFNVGGCIFAAYTAVFSEMGANGGTGGVLIIPQTGPDPVGGLWVSQSAGASLAGGPTQLDTCTQMIIQPDSIVTGVLTGNIQTQTRPDYLRARAHSWVRFVIVNTGTTNDTTMVKAVLTRIW